MGDHTNREGTGLDIIDGRRFTAEPKKLDVTSYFAIGTLQIQGARTTENEAHPQEKKGRAKKRGGEIRLCQRSQPSQ